MFTLPWKQGMEQRFETPVKKPQHSQLCTPCKAKKISFQAVRGAFFFVVSDLRTVIPWTQRAFRLHVASYYLTLENRFVLSFFFRCVVIVIVFSKIIQSSSKSKGSCDAIAFLTRQHDLHVSLLPATFKETERG